MGRCSEIPWRCRRESWERACHHERVRNTAEPSKLRIGQLSPNSDVHVKSLRNVSGMKFTLRRVQAESDVECGAKPRLGVVLPRT